jgi:hypothetical protein
VITDPVRQSVERLREALLRLHKALIDSERTSYEQTVGKIESPYQFLQLVTRDPWFAWLQPFSQLIVSIDEAVDSEEPMTQAQVEAFTKEAGALLIPSDVGDGFSKHYFEAMQRDPDVVLAHGELMGVVRAAKKPEDGSSERPAPEQGARSSEQ